jgi:uncharacterized membrane protein
MRHVLIATLILSLITALFGYMMMPDRIASHFGPDGQADGWSDKGFFTVLMVLIDLMMFGMFYWSHVLLEKVDARFISLPNREYWLTDANKPAGIVKLRDYMAEFGVATMLLLIYAKVSTIMANAGSGERLNSGIFLWVIIIYLVYTIWWCVRLITAYRVPKGVGG